MPLYIKDDAIDSLARRYQAAVNAPSKTEAVRRALQRAIKEEEAKQPLADAAAAFCRKLKLKAGASNGKPADKAFRDGLYE